MCPSRTACRGAEVRGNFSRKIHPQTGELFLGVSAHSEVTNIRKYVKGGKDPTGNH